MATTIESDTYDSSVSASTVNNNEASSYNDTYNELAFEYGQTAYTKKLLNTTLSAQQKLEVTKNRLISKELNLDGFNNGQITAMWDGDSGRLKLSDGTEQEFRLVTSQHFDTTDKKEVAENRPYKAKLQPKVVAALTGNSNPTTEDYQNVANYQYNEMLNSLSNKDYKFTPYNKDTSYVKNSMTNSIPVAYKVTGKDNDGRLLIEAVNTNSMRDVTFDASLNPYLNDSFDIFQSTDTTQNRERIRNYKVKNKGAISAVQELIDKYDTDNRLLEDLDMVQASFYRMWARAAQYGPEAIMNTDYWAKVADESTGQEIADAWAGVKTSTRRTIANEMTKGVDQWKNGNYVDSIITIGSQFDRLFAESAAQTLTGVAVGAATLGVGLAAGASAATASTIAMLSGATTAAVDNTLMSMEEYEANNGKAMSGADAAKTFAGYIALAIPETVFGALGIGKLLPKAVTSSMNSVYKQGAKLNAGKHLVGGIVGEAAQEMGEESFGTYMSQDEKNAQSFGDILTSPETAVAGVAGGVMGGGLAAIPAGKGFIFDARKEAKQDKEREKVVEQQATKTVTGATLNKVQETEAQATISRILNTAPTADTYTSGKPVDGNEIKKYAQDLDKVIVSNASEKTIAQATEVKSALIKRYVENLKTDEERESFLSDLGMTPSEVLAEQASSVNARNTYIKTGKRLTSEANDKVRKELESYGKLLGMTDEEISKTLEEVIVEARDSWKGYKTYEKRINNALITLNTEGASEDDIELAKADLSSSAKQVTRFYGNQLGKLDALVSGLTKLADTDTLKSITVKYPSGKGKFTITAADIISRGHESGVSRTFRAVLNEAKELQRIINTLPEETKKAYELDKLNLDELDTLKTTFNNAIDKYITHEGNVAKAKVATKSKTTDKGLDATNAISMLKSLHSKTKYNDNVIATMHTRLATVSDTTFNEIVNTLNNDKTLSDSTRQSHINTLINIRNRFTQSAQNVSKLQEQQAEAIKEVENIVSKFSDVSKIFGTINKQTAKTILENSRKRLLAINTKESKALLAKLTPVLNKVLNSIKEDKEYNEKRIKYYKENQDKLQTLNIDGVEIKYLVYPESLMQGMYGFGGTTGIAINEKLINDTSIDQRVGYFDAISRVEKHGININDIRSKMDKDTFLKSVILHEYRHTQQPKLFNNFKAGQGRWELDAELYALLHTGLITQKQYDTIYNAELKPYVKEKAQVKTSKQNVKTVDTATITESTTNQQKSKETTTNTDDTLIASVKNKASTNTVAVNKVLGIVDTATEEDSELLRNLENGYTDNEDAYFADEPSSDDAILSAVKGKADTAAVNKVLGITTVEDTTSTVDTNTEDALETFVRTNANKNAALNIIATSQTANVVETVAEETTNAAEENTVDETQEIEAFYKENHLSDLVHSPEELLDVEKNPIVNNTFEGTPDREGKSRLVITTPIIHDIKPINSNRRISTVMEEGVKNFEYLKSVVAIVNKALRLDFSAYKRTSEKINIYRALSSFSPHMNLLYATGGSSTSTIKDTGKTITKYYGTEMNPSVLLAIDFACKDLLSSMSIDDTFTPKDKSRVLSLFHINDETTSIKDYKLLRDEVKKHGIPKNAFARRLGKLAMQHIGLTKRKYDAQHSDLKPKYGGYERLEIGMGLFALDYMVAKGLITYDAINPTEVNAKATDGDLLTSEHKIKTIKVKNKTAIEKEVAAFLGEFVNATDEKGNVIKDINGKAKRVRSGNGLKSLYYKDKTNNIYGPSTKPIESNEDAMYIDGTNDMMIVPEFQRKRIEKVQQTPHIINSELVELLENNIETVKDNLGYSEQVDINNMHSDAASSAEGVNASIDSQLNYLIEYNNKQLAEPNTKWYFKAFFSKNGRLFYDSPTLNPQSGKSLTRFLVLPEELYSVFKVGNKNDEMLENYAISQAFDYLGNQEASDNLHKALNSLTAEELKQMLSDFVSMKHSEFFKKYNAILSKAVGAEVKLKGVENFGQCLNTLQHLYKKKEYIESGSKGEFKSWLSVENDSTTSGYAIRILQYPSEKIVKNFAKKVGLMEANDEDANTPMHILKKKKGFLDIYKTIAKDVADILAPIFNGTLNVSDVYIRYNKAYPKKMLRANVDVLSKAFELAKNALPKPEIKDGEIVISSALRALMKPVVMVFGYTGGKSAITSNMSEDIAENYLNSFMTIQTAGGLDAYIKANNITDKDEVVKLKSIYDTMSYIASMHEKANTPVKFYNLLKTTGVSDVWLQVGPKQKLTLDRFLNEMFMPIYGEAAWNTLENHFADHNANNELVNTAIASMYQLFSKVWQPVYDNMLKNANTTQAAFERKVEELAGLWPSIPLIYTELKSLTDGKTDLTYDELRKSVLLMNFERQPSKIGNISNALPKMENGKRVYDSDGKPKFDTSTSDAAPDLKVFANPKKAGAVVPIHYIDGMIMAATLAETLGIPVHDALVMSFSSVTEGTRNYNEALYYICEQYDLFGLIVDRFNKVVDEYEKFRTSTDRDYVKYREENLKGAKLPSIEEMQIIDGFGKIFKPKYADYYFDYYTGTSNDYLTFTDLQEALESARRDNTADRQAYFSKQHSIANMDGPKGSVVSSDDIHTAAVYAAGAQYASASGFVSSGKMEELLNTTNFNPKARIEIIHKLQELAKTLGNTVMSDEYVSHIENLIGKLNIDQIKNYTVNVIKDAEFTSGIVKHDTKEILVGFDSKQGTDIDSTTDLSIRSQQSAVEIYAHETIHAATRYALVNLKLTKAYKEIQQLLNLQKAAMEVVTWEDFMPDNYDSNLRDVYEVEAKKTWDYIFNNKNTEELAGLSEFMAYGLTNPKLMAKLKQHTVVEKQAKGSILDRLVSFFKNLLGILTGNATVGETHSSLMDLLKGNRVAFKHSETIYQELDRLVTQLSHADKKTINKFLKHPYKAIETLYTVYRLAMKKGNSYLVPAIKYVTNYLDNHNMQYSMGSKINSNWFSTPKKLAALVAGYAFSSSRRQALKEVLAALTGASQQSLLASIYRDVTISDAASSTLEAYSMHTRMIDANSKGIEALSYQDIMSKFDKALDDKDTESLTRTCLFTDLQCLTNDMSIKQIKELLTNSFALNDEIMRTEHAISSIDEKDYMWLRNQAFGLARFMVTGVGNECQNLNAYNIAAKLMMDNEAHTIDTKVVKLVDKLATLYALSFTDNSVKKITAQLNDAGLENYLKQAKAFVEENVTGTTKTGEDAKTVETLHIVKGYTKQILDDSYDVRVDAVANKDALNDAGYVLVTKLADNDATGLKGLALYRRSLARPRRREGAAFALNGAHAIGTTLKDTAYSVGGATNSVDAADLVLDYKKGIRIAGAKLNRLMKSKEMTLQDFSVNSSGYTPILSTDSGNPVDYRITMSTDNKVKHLGMELDGTRILSKMFATHNTKLEAKVRNNALIDFLYGHMNENMNDNYRDADGNKYVKITPNTTNKYLKEAWKVIPETLKYKVNEKPLYVREDWLQYLFGVENMSAVDLVEKRMKHQRPALWKRAVTLTEALLQTVAYAAKRAVVLFTPGVLVGNELSNINYSAMTHGVGFLKVARMHLRNAQATRDYIDTKKELNKILFKERIGTATTSEINKKRWLRSKLENNVVHPLMEKGMYQAIVEDLSTSDLEATGKLQKFIKNLAAFKKIPKPLKTLARVLYLGEGTFVSNLMTQATQYSDFVARATEYQLQIANAPERYEMYTINGKKLKRESDKYRKYEEKVSKDILDTFINYDKPQSSIEQYSNDMGFLMFTKFAKRIQGVIGKTITENPMGAIMFLLTQGMVYDTEDILEHNVLSKRWSSLVHNPIDNFVNTIVPVPVQYALDMRQMW